MRLWRLLLLPALLVVLALGIAACGDDEDDEGGGSTGGETASGEVLTIGVKFDVPPFGFKNPQTGDVEGFDVDLGKRIAEKLGREPKFIEAISDNRIPFLMDGTVDLILSTMTITAERDLEIDFSEPYFVARGRILVPQDSDIQGSTTWPARRSAPRSGRRTRRRSRSRRRRPTCGSSTPTRSASSWCRTRPSTPSRPTT